MRGDPVRDEFAGDHHRHGNASAKEQDLIDAHYA